MHLVLQAEPSTRSIFTQQGVIGASAPGSTLVIEPPSAAEEFDLSDSSDESEDDDRPLTRAELEARMQRKLAQQTTARGTKPRRRK